MQGDAHISSHRAQINEPALRFSHFREVVAGEERSLEQLHTDNREHELKATCLEGELYRQLINNSAAFLLFLR